MLIIYRVVFKDRKVIKNRFSKYFVEILTLKQKIGGILSIIPLTVALILIYRDCIKLTGMTSYKLNSFNYVF